MNGERWQVVVALWDSLSRRERFLLGGMTALLLGLLMYWTIGGVLRRSHDMEVELKNQRFNLRSAQQLKVEKKRLQALVNKRREINILSHLELLVGQLGLQEQVKIKEIASNTRSVASVEVQIDALPWDEVVYMIYLIESSSVPMVIRLSEVSRAFNNPDLLRLRLQVVGL